ncbi:hypothetical protein KZX45_02580 [Georgenia sp. EYE_87]|uniref:hypothetical protein n=1 Tax=Georgenia sp. EYE_87 TaxID=2853448 RepID=UPI002003B45B|nr:hypothetical protein [Georgenia sp. EYE_87]MCK6209426.1 hypothetical protein [Georgenia sp. EYE_87]
MAGITWRMELPEGWVVWEPGSPDVVALRAAAATTRRAGLSVTQAVGVLEKELEELRGTAVQAGLRVPDPRTGLVTASLRLSRWPRPEENGTVLDARRYLDQVKKVGPDAQRVYQHREVSLATVPAGQLVLTNEIWRRKWGMRSVVRLATTVFPEGTGSIFELEITSRYPELQPALMAETSLMAHGLTVTEEPA